MHKERIAQLIARKLSGEASPEEITELDALFKEHPEDAYFLSILKDYWASPVSSVADEDADPEAHFRHILNAAATEREEPALIEEPAYSGRSHTVRNILAIAAVLTGMIFFSWLYLNTKPGVPELSRIETIAKPGAKSRLLLPDGSVVWLNSGSRISYPANFTDSLREVELEGEAYFDVAKDSRRPFVVLTRDINIKVLGTVFNVKCYPEDNRTEATLIRGLVQVSKNGESQQEALLLHPHEKVVINRALETVSAGTGTADPNKNNMIVKHLKESTRDTSMAEIAWVYNKLVFDGEDFREIAAEIERWYNVKIAINDSTVAGYRFHARFENESITEVLSALRVSLPFTFKINNNEVNIYK